MMTYPLEGGPTDFKRILLVYFVRIRVAWMRQRARTFIPENSR